MSTAGPVKKYLLFFTYVDNMLEKRGPYRKEHLAKAQKLVDENIMILGGAYDPQTDGAVYIFKSDYDTIERFVKADPYYRAGLIPKYRITEWNLVLGKL
jgi:uncharacterized protein YciI